MRIHTRRGPTTEGFIRAAVLPLLVLMATACAGAGGAGPAPGPPSGPPPAGAEEDEPAARFPRSIDAIRQITLRKGRLGWGGLEVGMTFRQAELVLGHRLPALGSSLQDELCGYYRLEAELLRQPLRLEWAAEAGESHLQAFWLPLQSRSGTAGRDEIVAALHARFPKLEHIPSPHEPDLPEENNPQPLYRVPEGGGMIFVQPGGIYFGEVCVD
jgi:hypothetical protein